MARLKMTDHLTTGYRPDIAKTMQQTHAGQAHFANGPLGAVCKDCVFYGAWRQVKSASGEIVSTSRVKGACEKYRQLTGKLGATFPESARACRHFIRKDNDSNGGEK